jgi:NADP-dependent 3-hydroxy acid dehydrogenase YdfG
MTTAAHSFERSDRLRGTVALVTGASSGIGEATARALASHGASIALVARRADRLATLAAEIRAGGVACAWFAADLADREAAARAVADAAASLGRIDTVVNNAGLMLLGPALSATLDDWDRMLAVNLHGSMYIAHAALPHLVRAAAGDPRRVADLVNVSSVAGRLVRPGGGAYSATKHGLGAFAEGLRQELGGKFVRVSLIEPGSTATELRSHNRAEVVEAIKARLGPIEVMQAHDVAESICHIVTRPRHVSVNELLIRPTEQQT